MAFRRDIFAMLTRYINGYLSTEGTAWDRCYGACVRGEEALGCLVDAQFGRRRAEAFEEAGMEA